MMRLLSPTCRKIYEPMSVDEIRTAEQLQDVFGWKPYDGPAKTNRQGFVIPGTDPALTRK